MRCYAMFQKQSWLVAQFVALSRHYVVVIHAFHCAKPFAAAVKNIIITLPRIHGACLPARPPRDMLYGLTISRYAIFPLP